MSNEGITCERDQVKKLINMIENNEVGEITIDLENENILDSYMGNLYRSFTDLLFQEKYKREIPMDSFKVIDAEKILRLHIDMSEAGTPKSITATIFLKEDLEKVLNHMYPENDNVSYIANEITSSDETEMIFEHFKQSVTRKEIFEDMSQYIGVIPDETIELILENSIEYFSTENSACFDTLDWPKELKNNRQFILRLFELGNNKFKSLEDETKKRISLFIPSRVCGDELKNDPDFLAQLVISHLKYVDDCNNIVEGDTVLEKKFQDKLLQLYRETMKDSTYVVQKRPLSFNEFSAHRHQLKNGSLGKFEKKYWAQGSKMSILKEQMKENNNATETFKKIIAKAYERENEQLHNLSEVRNILPEMKSSDLDEIFSKVFDEMQERAEITVEEIE